MCNILFRKSLWNCKSARGNDVNKREVTEKELIKLDELKLIKEGRFKLSSIYYRFSSPWHERHGTMKKGNEGMSRKLVDHIASKRRKEHKWEVRQISWHLRSLTSDLLPPMMFHILQVPGPTNPVLHRDLNTQIYEPPASIPLSNHKRASYTPYKGHQWRWWSSLKIYTNWNSFMKNS